jgi:hypothetical protein
MRCPITGEALRLGKLFDDKGNRMGPSFSSKNGVRYRFYVSTALNGRNIKPAQTRGLARWSRKKWLLFRRKRAVISHLAGFDV